MATDFETSVDARSSALRAALDRLIPPVDELPGAGTLVKLDDVDRMADQHPRYRQPLAHFTEALSLASTGSAFPSLTGEAQDTALRHIEASWPADFALVLELVYLAYYARPEVHHRIGWRTGPLQPLGFELPPFDPAVLETVKRRRPLWRQAPDGVAGQI
jgi:hypothetical protein